MSIWSSVGAQLFVGVMLQYGALPTNYPDPEPDIVFSFYQNTFYIL